MKLSELQLYLRGRLETLTFPIATDERNRWIEQRQPEIENSGFGEYRTVDHYHLFINSDHVVASRLLNDQMLNVSDNYDAQWKRREQPDSKTGEFAPELWRFRFWITGCEQPFEVADLDEHDFVTISCSLLDYEHQGKSYLTLTDEDGEPISLRIADVMLAAGFDYRNYEIKNDDPKISRLN